MAFNFGAFAGGVVHGVEQGIKLTDSIDSMQQKMRIQKLREQGMAEAEQARLASVQGMIKENGVSDAPTSGPIDATTPKVETPEAQITAVPGPTSVTATPLPPVGLKPAAVGANAEGNDGEAEAQANMTKPAPAAPEAAVQPSVAQPTPAQASAAQATPQQAVASQGVVTQKPSGKFSVNGQSYDTREQAMAAADKAAPSTMDFFMKNAVPKIAQQYVVNGDPATAKAWTDYAESQNGKRAIKDWAAAYSAPDMDTAVARFGKYYTDHINDGVDYTGHKLVTKTDGTQVAVVTLKDKATGKSQEMELTREKMLALGGANNPQKLFEQEVAKQREAEKLKYEASLKAQERREKRQDDLVLKKYEADRQDSREGIKQDRLDQRVDRESRNRMDEIGLRAQLKVDLGEDGASAYKKMTDPRERVAMLDKALSDKSHPDSREYSKMNREEKDAFLLDRMKRYDSIGSKVTTKEGQPAGTGIADKPMAYDSKLPVRYNKATGKPYHLVNGQYVPIQGAVPPQAGGLPQR